jgi:hypothetical protein
MQPPAYLFHQLLRYQLLRCLLRSRFLQHLHQRLHSSPPTLMPTFPCRRLHLSQPMLSLPYLPTPMFQFQ